MCLTAEQCLECEIFLTSHDLEEMESHPDEFFNLMATASKRQRVEVKIKDLSPKENQEFKEAKYKEVEQWIATETVRKVLKDKIPEENILRSRWVLTWKELDAIDAAREGKNRKAKARLVMLGYEDPDITNIPQDSPTLQKESRLLILQMCASMKWIVRSLGIKTARVSSRQSHAGHGSFG